MAYNVSNEYKQVIYSGDSRHKIKILFNNVELQEADRYCERATIKSRILPNGAKRFSLNNFISKEVEIILHDIDTSIIQDQVSISIGTLVGNSYEYVPIGIFNIQDTPTNDKSKTTIKLRDNSVKFDFNYNAKPLIDEKGGSATKLQILQDICTKANVTCNISSFIGSTDSIGIYDNTITARQYIADLAEQAGRIATINRNGELIFVNLNSLTTWNIPLSIVEKYEIGKAYRIGKVVYEDAIRKYETASTNYDTLYLDASNPYISSQSQVNSILQQVNNFAIDSVKTGKILGNPAIDSYDLINVYDDKTQGNPSIFKTLATNELVYTGVLINTFNTQIGEEERKENVTVTGEATFKKWATTNINNINGEIDIQAGKIDNVEKEINPTQDASGSSIYLEDSTNAELVNFEMEGKTTQETRSGKNLFNTNTSFIDNEYYSCTNNKITVLQYDGRSWGNIYDFALKPNTTYTLSTENTGRIYIGKDKAFFAYVDDNKFTFTTSNTGSTQIKFLPPSSNDTYPFAVGYVQLELGSTATDYEQYGVQPSPDYPSELVSVGYRNLFDSATFEANLVSGKIRNDSGAEVSDNTSTYSTYMMPIKANKKYNIKGFLQRVYLLNSSGTFVSRIIYNSSTTLPMNTTYTPTIDGYFQFQIRNSAYNSNKGEELVYVGTQSHSYIPYGKYGIEVKTQGKNLFNENQLLKAPDWALNSNGYYYGTFNNYYNTFRYGFDNDYKFKENTQYTLSARGYVTANYARIYIYYTDGTNSSLMINNTTDKIYSITSDVNKTISYLSSSYGSGGSNILYIKDILLEEGTQATTYEEYKSKTYLYTLNQPLRSISNTKDLLYIRNGMLYVERRIGSVVLNGSEVGWSYSSTYKQYQLSNSTLIKGVKNSGSVMSNYFVSTNISGNYQVRIGNASSLLWIFDKTDYFGANANSFKTWLSTHNTEVQYILAEPYIEEVGQVDIPNTYKTITHIDTTDELEPNMDITYVMNTQITNYVQNQVNQIKITEDGILAEVNRKVDNEEIIAKLNLAIEDEQGIIEITGNQVTIDSDYFKLNADGTIKSTGGTIGGYKITDNMLYAETFAKYNYTENDLAKIRNYLMGTGTLTPEEFIKYDVDESGTVTSLDYVIIKFFIEYNVTPTSSAKIIMQTGNSISDNAYVLQDGVGNEILNIGFNGIYYKDINLANTTTYSENELVVGKWIDNKPIYRKVIDIGNLPNTSQTTVNHNISNIERIVKLYGSATRDSDKDTLPIPYVTFNSNNSGGINLYADNVSVFVSTSSDRSSYTGYVVLEYTKTSD